ncbi:MAG: SPOR domain-containing protein [candidate division NC10 bacterium]|nr:SPOR domain-containing protein [candidate division NC10 bacterium]
MRKIDLSGDSGEINAPSGLTPRAKRLLVLLLIVVILGAGAYAAQKFLFPEKRLAPPPAPPLAQLPPPVPQLPAKPPQSVPPASVAPAVPSPPSTPASKEVKWGEPLKPGLEATRSEAKAKPAPPRQRFSIQVVSCAEEKNARSLASRLQAEGLSARIMKGRATLTRHRTYVGHFSSLEEAREMGERLHTDGISATLQPMEPGKYAYLIASSYALNDAIDRAHELSKKGYVPSIRSSQVQAPVYRVLVGRFAHRAEAIKPIQRLKEMGYSPILVKGS